MKKKKNVSGTEFMYRGQKIYVDFETLQNECKAFCASLKVSHFAEDFASWAVAHVLKKIERGNRLYKEDRKNPNYCERPYLNKCLWLYTQYMDENYGMKQGVEREKLIAKLKSNPTKKNLAKIIQMESKKSSIGADKWTAQTNTVHGEAAYTLMEICADSSMNAEEKILFKEEKAERIKKIEEYFETVTDRYKRIAVAKLLKKEREEYEAI